jgi:putative redox protein
MQVTVKATADMQFSATAPNGTVCALGASQAVGGDGSGFRPMELLLASLASCSAIDAVLILKKMQVAFSHIDIEVQGERVEGTPSPYKTIHILFKVRKADAANLAKAQKAVGLSVEKYCSVGSSLDPNIKVTHQTVIDDGE